MDKAAKSLPQSLLPPLAVASSPYLGLFTKPELQANWYDADVKTFGPINVVEGEKISFSVPKLGGRTFMNLGDTFISLGLQLVDSSGNVPPSLDSDKKAVTVAPCDAFTSAMFSHIKIYLNDVPITTGSGLLPFGERLKIAIRDPFEKQLSYYRVFGHSKDVGSSFWKDQVGGIGWEKRKMMFGSYPSVARRVTLKEFVYSKDIKTFFLELVSDLSSTDMMLPPDVAVRVECFMNPSGFYMQSSQPAFCAGKGYRLKVCNAKLRIPTMRLVEPKWNHLQKEMSLGHKLEYHCKRHDCRTVLLKANNRRFSIDTLRVGQVAPDTMLIMLINAWCIDNYYDTSPYMSCPEVFTKAHVSDRDVGSRGAFLESMQLTINNEVQDESPHDWTHDQLVKHKFAQTQAALGARELPQFSAAINLTTYRNGDFVVAYDLTKARRNALCGSAVRQVPQTGAARLDLTFSSGVEADGKIGLPCDAYLVILSEYHSRITIDGSGDVSYRFID